MTTQQDIETLRKEIDARLRRAGLPEDHAVTDALSRILATLERLPLTADGVVVTVGMKLVRSGGGEIHTAVMGVETGDFYDPSYLDDADFYYSTPEAAQASQAKTPDQRAAKGGAK